VDRAADHVHMVRRIVGPAIAAILFASAVAAPAGARQANSAGPARISTAMRALESGILADLNRVRTQHGLVPLRPSGRLNAAASQHSREMARVGYFSHNSADGSAFWRRIQRFYPSSGYGSWSVGENLLWSSPDVDAAGAIKMWMGSPEHRANLLNPSWREVGLSAVHSDSAPGTYHGLGVTIVTADFGARTK
jgi:uncharacterized protein YkwD